jgi:hypothetical protein
VSLCRIGKIGHVSLERLRWKMARLDSEKSLYTWHALLFFFLLGLARWVWRALPHVVDNILDYDCEGRVAFSRYNVYRSVAVETRYDGHQKN